MIEARICRLMIQWDPLVGHMPIQINLRRSSPPLPQKLGNRAKQLIFINIRAMRRYGALHGETWHPGKANS